MACTSSPSAANADRRTGARIDFWQSQPFDLRLLSVNGRTLEGNCDLCFLKPQRQRLALIKARPKSA